MQPVVELAVNHSRGNQVPVGTCGATDAPWLCRVAMALSLSLVGVWSVNPVDLSAQVAKMYPVDEAQDDPSFFMFRLRLADAVARRDTTFLYGHFHPQIKTSLGGDVGLNDFRRTWRPASPDTELWSTLAQLLAAGGSFGGGGELHFFQAPYWNAEWDGSEFDPYDYGVIIGEEVNVRAGPTTESTALASLSYDVVRVLDYYPPESVGRGRWVKVELVTGASGYVGRDFIRSPIGYRIAFSRVDGEWMIQWFLAGD